jgi:predicted HicB family RNase H-like nuclease
MMDYKGYIGYVEFDDESEIFHGEVINTRDVITFQGKSVSEIKQEFQKSVDVYLDFCKQHGKKPDKPFSGKITLRLSPDLHRRIYAAAKCSGKSLNQWVADQIGQTV